MYETDCLKLLSRQMKKNDDYAFSPRFVEKGKVVSVGDGIVWIEGLESAGIDEILIFDDGSQAVVFHLTESLIGGILIKQTDQLTAGMSARHLKRNLTVKVGENLLGRVINSLGEPLDGLANPKLDYEVELERSSPPIYARDFVNDPLFTGNRMIDSLIPIGKGQRQLLIGDNGLGKSALAMDIVANQANKDVICIYVLIAQNRSNVLNVIQTLKEVGAMDHCVVVVAEANSLPGLQYLAPFAGCSIAEYWMLKGLDTLIVYDDLTAHAQCYRELSLLLRRPPGREAYPADIFYLHSRLLERSTCLSVEHGGGTMTALPIIETKEGEIASYIPTNLISITDGQVYFDIKEFSAGYLPAIDITKSVSRVGGQAQLLKIKKEAGRMKLDYLQYFELETFTRFGAKLEKTIQERINRGRVLRVIFKQDILSPTAPEELLGWLIAYNEGIFDNSKPEFVDKILSSLFNWIKLQKLDFKNPRDEWVNKIRKWSEKGYE
ncbi:F0F1 ATP synthase subunit alpha [Halobacteriovorax sp. GFR7]|uniref:F0F1 ATP synthase subunit alpha n=1 Tax=unclassified Halobacteriovorax TaxID=2639665 RepID=UPI003D9935A2